MPTIQARIKRKPKYSRAERVHGILRMLVLGALVASAIWGWLVIRDPERFPITQVAVEATYQHVEPQALRQIIQPYLQEGFFAVDVSALQEQILQLPWVATADIERVWPAKLVVKIQEQKPVAQWGKQALLNDKGVIFTPPPATMPNDLPHLSGPDQQASMLWQTYLAMVNQLAPLGLSVTKLEQDDRGAYQLQLSDDTWILLGRNDAMKRLTRFVSFYPKIFTSPEQSANKIDLRYDNGIAITWQNGDLS